MFAALTPSSKTSSPVETFREGNLLTALRRLAAPLRSKIHPCLRIGTTSRQPGPIPAARPRWRPRPACPQSN